MSNPLSYITSQFPEYGDTIRILYLVDDDFKTLCDDFYASKMHSRNLRDKISEQQWEDEYQHLSAALEKEIIEYIANRELG